MRPELYRITGFVTSNFCRVLLEIQPSARIAVADRIWCSPRFSCRILIPDFGKKTGRHVHVAVFSIKKTHLLSPLHHSLPTKKWWRSSSKLCAPHILSASCASHFHLLVTQRREWPHDCHRFHAFPLLRSNAIQCILCLPLKLQSLPDAVLNIVIKHTVARVAALRTNINTDSRRGRFPTKKRWRTSSEL